jgi:calcineurin-like phosphoesterase family protein
MMRWRFTAPLLAVACAFCGGTATGPGSTPSVVVPPDPPVPIPSPPPPPAETQIFVGAGDIAMCDANSEATAKLLDGIGGTVFTVGDQAYFSGSADEYRRCYDPTWGRHKGRTRPVAGNHEYLSPGAAPYFAYFGAAAGPPGLGYYSFDIGGWHAIALNSNIDSSAGSTQGAWLRSDLAGNRFRCTIAYWHHPLFTSGPDGASPHMQDFWRMLYDAGVDVVLNGHEHYYERFAPQDPTGTADPGRGIREFIVGTGGAVLYQPVAVRPNSERRLSTFGVLKLTLQPDAYQWDFIAVSGAGDAGSGTCH